jgi:putative ABC transport system permease protein
VRTADLLVFAGTALLRHRLRTLLSLLGVAIGVTSVVVLTSLGEGARRYVLGQFTALGTNLVVVIPGKNETTGALPGIGGAPRDLTLDDAQAIRREVRGIARIAPLASGTEAVSNGERSRQVPVLGTTHAFKEVRRLGLSDGEFLPEMEARRGAPIVVLGKKVAREIFPGERPIGRVVRIGEFRMRVIGVMDSRGVQLGVDIDDAVVVPVATGLKMFNKSSLFRILVDAETHADLERMKNDILALMARRHEEEDITCLTQDAVVSSLSSILTALTLALAGIGAVSLGVAGVGIMNVMLVSVSERTFEVGLLAAVGAVRRQILAAFLFEAALLSTAGGTAGLLLGFAVIAVVRRLYPAFPVAAPFWAVALALGVSVSVGVVFGLLPAARASRLDPVHALARKG